MAKERDRMEVLAPSVEDVDAARDLEASLRASASSPLGVSVAGVEHVLPKRAAGFVRAVVREIARGRRVALIELDGELTTTEAAEVLNISRPTLVGLLKRNLIPHRLVGTHRRVTYAALIEYRKHHAPTLPRSPEDRLRETDALLRQWHDAEGSSEP